MQKDRLLSGFTLIELLLVIVILGIVISIAVSIINPARIQRRSQESVLISQTSKLCTALFACASVNDVYTSCNQFVAGEIEAVSPNGTPPSSTYQILGTTTITIRGTLTAGNGSKTSGTSCQVSCSYNFSTGASGPITKSAGCY